MQMVLVTTGDPDESGQLAQRQIEGVYTLDEAIDALCLNVEGLNRVQMLSDLKKLVEEGKVKVDRQGTLDLTPTPAKVRAFYEVAQWDILNTHWLSKYQHIDWQFPDPLDRLRPDWSYWTMHHLSLEDAICLSINITPDWNKYSKHIGRKNTISINYGYAPRFANASSYAQDSVWRYENMDEVTNQVKLSEFARWVVKEKPDWQLPSEFRALAKISEVLVNENTKSKKGRPQSLKKEDVDKLIQMKIKNPTLSHDFLAEKFGVSRKTIGNYLKKHDRN